MEQGGGGGRDLTGSPKQVGGKCWAKKLVQMIDRHGPRSCLFQDLFQYFANVLNIGSVNFAVLWIIDVALNLIFSFFPFVETLESNHFLLQWYLQVLPALLKRYTGSHKYGIDSMMHRKKIES